MSGNQTVDARAQALMSLLMCARYIAERDPIIRRADAAGIPKAEIARIIGLSRQTVSGIINRHYGGRND